MSMLTATRELRDLAAKHADATSSSRLCRNQGDAYAALFDENGETRDLVLSARLYLRSLAHSVGVFHPDYRAAEALLPEAEGRWT